MLNCMMPSIPVSFFSVVSTFNIVDSFSQGLARAYQGGLLLAHGSNFGWIPLRPPQ